ncbi:hypothetical protein H8356DRAFT_1432061 [Neocallimastix lanati (nom. inval.)]|nr:hypothetical protein H8356DRAFT_1432061 [Neocallimastix sp. JGI-2020a]
MVFKRLSLDSILDPTPAILRYILIICTDDIMGEWFLFGCSWSMEIYVGMLGNTAPGRCYITPNSYIYYCHNVRWIAKYKINNEIGKSSIPLDLYVLSIMLFNSKITRKINNQLPPNVVV